MFVKQDAGDSAGGRRSGAAGFRRPALAFGAALSLAACAAPGDAVAAGSACPGAGKPVLSATRVQARRAVICLVNRQRVERGLPPLRANPKLSRSAQGWSRTMVATGDFTHGSDFATRITHVGFLWSTAGENIASGFVTPAEVVGAWMASAGHCQNILDPAFSEIGVGIVAHPVRDAASGPATWTADFARPAGSAAPSTDDGPMDGCPYTS